MKVIYNNIIPIKGFTAINLFGVIFVRKGSQLTNSILNHETIHTVQMKELLYVFFYAAYIIEWFIRLFLPGNAYRNISFEREAYANEKKSNYLATREWCAWIKYLKN